MSFSRGSTSRGPSIQKNLERPRTVEKFREDFKLKDNNLWKEILRAARRIMEEEGLTQYAGKQRYQGWKSLAVEARRSARFKVFSFMGDLH